MVIAISIDFLFYTIANKSIILLDYFILIFEFSNMSLFYFNETVKCNQTLLFCQFQKIMQFIIN